MGENPTPTALDTEGMVPTQRDISLPSFGHEDFDDNNMVRYEEPRLSDSEEDMLLKVGCIILRPANKCSSNHTG